MTKMTEAGAVYRGVTISTTIAAINSTMLMSIAVTVRSNMAYITNDNIIIGSDPTSKRAPLIHKHPWRLRCHIVLKFGLAIVSRSTLASLRIWECVRT